MSPGAPSTVILVMARHVLSRIRRSITPDGTPGTPHHAAARELDMPSGVRVSTIRSHVDR
jgi:hypothetical protein